MLKKSFLITFMVIAMVATLGLIQGCSESDKVMEPLLTDVEETFDEQTSENNDSRDVRPVMAASASSWPTHITHFEWPVVRNQVVRVTAGYGPNGGSPYHKGREYYALDLVNGSAPQHTRWMWVVNPARGVVRDVGYSRSRGWYVIMDHHNGWESRIYHLQTDPRAFIRKGNDLLQGTFLGYTGSSGWATGPHIHFVVLRNGWSVPLNGIDGDYDLRIGWNYTSSNYYVRPPYGNP